MDLHQVSFYSVPMESVSIEKDEDNERSVPTRWRASLKTIADELVSGRVPFGKDIKEIDDDTFRINTENIADYPETIGALSEKTWETSCCIWTHNFWSVLVDLSTENGESSDLVLHARIYPNGDDFEFEPGLIYVP